MPGHRPLREPVLIVSGHVLWSGCLGWDLKQATITPSSLGALGGDCPRPWVRTEWRLAQTRVGQYGLESLAVDWARLESPASSGVQPTTRDSSAGRTAAS